MNKLIIAGVAAGVALAAFVVFVQVGSGSSHKEVAQQASLSNAAQHLAIAAPVKTPPTKPITPPATL